MASGTIKAAVVGSSGYAGGELMRVLLRHPHVTVTAVTSERSAGQPIVTLFPHLSGLTDLLCEHFEPEAIAEKADLVFLALPHMASMAAAHQLHASGRRVIDLSADYRLHDPAVYETWYEHRHQHPELLAEAVYGLPELHREQIKKASLIANPGCYPTGALLGLAPMITGRIVDHRSIIVDAASGVSGAGRTPSTAHHYPEVNEGFTAYKIARHRHTPEIEQELSELAGEAVIISFTPHLAPMNRGILSTIYARLIESMDTARLQSLFEQFFANEPFVRVLPPGTVPNVRNVRGSNFCDIGVTVDPRTGRAIVVTAIDNLVKGASGQAVQNMNLMMGLDETAGIGHAGIFP